MNTVILSGRWVKDNDVRTINGANGQTTVCNNRIAVDRRRQNQGQQESDFIDVSCFGRTADAVTKYTHKGSKVLISGRLSTGSYTDKEGRKVYTTSVIAETVEFLEKKPQDQDNGYNANAGTYGAQAPAPQQYQGAPAPQANNGYGAPAQQNNGYGAPAPAPRQYQGAPAPAPAPQANQQYGGSFAAAAAPQAAAPQQYYGAPAPAPAGNEGGFINIPDGISDEELPFH